ncbi:bacteriocin-like protein [Mucilaginibacter gotjawali]|uniref:bacteriocin-like protein n=1 Tax=Mucilaginibacter gotjawali TaxID=1550579 RepID=UPI004063C288
MLNLNKLSRAEMKQIKGGYRQTCSPPTLITVCCITQTWIQEGNTGYILYGTSCQCQTTVPAGCWTV